MFMPLLRPEHTKYLKKNMWIYYHPTGEYLIHELDPTQKANTETARFAYSGGWSPNWVHWTPRPFTVLLCLPRVIVRMENYSME
jgi:hypothetical protein